MKRLVEGLVPKRKSWSQKRIMGESRLSQEGHRLLLETKRNPRGRDWRSRAVWRRRRRSQQFLYWSFYGISRILWVKNTLVPPPSPFPPLWDSTSLLPSVKCMQDTRVSNVQCPLQNNNQNFFFQSKSAPSSLIQMCTQAGEFISQSQKTNMYDPTYMRFLE